MIKLLKATHQGKHRYGTHLFWFFVLENGNRIIPNLNLDVLTEKSIRNANISSFSSFLQSDLVSSRIKEVDKKVFEMVEFEYEGNRISGYNALMLSPLMDILKEGKKESELLFSVYKVFDRLLKAFSEKGLIKTIDSVTEYDHKVEISEIKNLLKLKHPKNISRYFQKVPNNFFELLFNLKGWELTIENIKIKNDELSFYINELVIKTLSSLDQKSLKNIDISDNPTFTMHVSSIVSYMVISEDWNRFVGNMNKLYPSIDLKYKGEMELTEFDLLLKKALSTSPQRLKNLSKSKTK